MRNKTIADSKYRAMAWGFYLLDTFRRCHIKDCEVIRNCHIGRHRFYRMKRGELINIDAYVRLMDYAHHCLKQRIAHKLQPPKDEDEWKTRFWEIMLKDSLSENQDI